MVEKYTALFYTLHLQHNSVEIYWNVLTELMLLTRWRFLFIYIITFFEKFVIESENDVLVLPFEDGFGSFVLL